MFNLIRPLNKISSILILIFFAEIFSLFGYLIPVHLPVFFAILAVLFLVLSVKDLRYGIFILLAELFIGSFGHLFYIELSGQVISIRMAFWLIIMAVWAGKKIAGLIKENKLDLNLAIFKENIDLMIFFLFLGMGLTNGFLNHNGLKNILLDFNGWLYFLLAFPLFDTIKKCDLKIIFNIFTASIIWISASSLFFLYIFSHFSAWDTYPLFRWLRDAGLGEVTLMPSGVYRIFFQSQIYALAGIFIIFIASFKNLAKLEYSKKIMQYFSLTALLLSSILISFSRSYWAGLAAGILLCLSAVLAIYRFKAFFRAVAVWVALGAASLAIILLVARFPFPRPEAGLNAKDLSDRFGQVSDEAGASSRWALLPRLWEEIRESPILGKGFGATVTYKSSDPRVLESSPSGEYTTYAFEWGWLDIWLKIGLIGLLAYLILILRISLQAVKFSSLDNPAYEPYKLINAGIIVGLLAIGATSIFSPYTNHPLGIGYLLLALLIINLSQNLNPRES
ncbi:MAG: O-antigen ligase family protein [Patescibacteria group bacterium]